MSDTEGNYKHISFKENENLEYKVHMKDPVPPNLAFHHVALHQQASLITGYLSLRIVLQEKWSSFKSRIQSFLLEGLH